MLGDSIAKAMPRLRAQAESQMRDTFAVFSPTWEKVDRIERATWTPEGITNGKVSGGSRDADTRTRTVRVGDSEREVVTGGLHIPIGAPVPEIGWEYQCTAVGPRSDAALLGRRWRVVNVPAKSQATARRLDVVEVTG